MIRSYSSPAFAPPIRQEKTAALAISMTASPTTQVSLPAILQVSGSLMEYGIQRRRIYLVPADAEDLKYVYEEFDREEVWEMFGFTGASGLKILRARRAGNLVLGMLKRVADRKRIGFVVMFPPTADFDFWEFGYAIREP